MGDQAATKVKVVSIENFNKWFRVKFWAKEIFANLEDMRTKSTHFVDHYNDLRGKALLGSLLNLILS